MEDLSQPGIRHLRQGEYQAAIALYEQWSVESLDDSDYAYWGLAWLLAGDLEQAQTIWLTALTLTDPDLFTTVLKGVLTTEAEILAKPNPTLAGVIYTQLLELEEQPATLYRLGWALAATGQLHQAIALWQDALELQPQFSVAWFAQGEVYQRLGQWEEAIAAYAQGLENDPEQTTARYNLGICLTWQGRWQEAIDCFKPLVEREILTSHGELAYLYLQQAQFAQALAHLRTAVQAAPDFVESYCRSMVQTKQTNVRLLLALRTQPRSGETCLNLGVLLAQRGAWQLAAGMFQQGLQWDADRAELRLEWGKSLAQAGDLPGSIDGLSRLVEQQPTWAIAWAELANGLAQTQQFDQAIAAYSQAVALDPQLYEAWLGLGQCWCRFDRWQDGVFAYQQALAGRPTAVDAHYYLGLAWAKQGQQQEAIAAFSQAMTINSAVANLVANTVEQLQNQGQLILADSASSLPIDAPTIAIVSSANSAGVTYMPIRSQTSIALKPPLTGDQRVHFSFCFEGEVELPETFVACIPQGRFWLDPDQSSLGIITGQNQLLADLSVEFPILSPDRRVDRPHWLFAAKKLQPPTVFDGLVVVLSGLSNHVYFHWMVDVLPRIELLNLAGIDWENVDGILVNNGRSFQMETLRILGVPQEKVLQTDQHLHLQASSLIVPSFSGSAAWMSREACCFLRNTFLNQICSPGTAITYTWERIYISRNQSASRCLINELEVTDLLKSQGFQIIVLETLSVVEQVALFANARVIVAPHGSGLTNLVFCNAETIVIELFSPNYVYPCYWYLANLVNVRYYYLLGELPLGVSLHTLLYPNPRIEDIFINLDALVDILKLARVMEG